MSTAAAPVGTPSTPATGSESAAPAATDSSVTASTETAPAAPTAPATPAAPSSSTDPPADPAKPAEKPADPPPTEKPPESKETAPDQPLFTLPEDVKLIDTSRTKFETFLKGKLADGKVSLTPQELLDHYLEHARDMSTLWVKQQEEANAANEAACKQRFTEAQLAAAETGVGFLSSFEPGFRETAKAFMNHPHFVAAMRIVGERLSEDTFAPAGGHRQPSQKRPADVLYPAKN